ncbi:MAG TPA: M50 family metallopeptidase [Streptosporangiaceae bacterium]|jgi:hypothetical protein
MLALSLELTQHQLENNLPLSSVPLGEPIGILVLLGFAAEGIWRLARHISVIAHEGAHALAGWSVGRKKIRVKLNSDATGETSSVGLVTGPGWIITGFVGYLGPSLFGLGAAVLLANHQVEAVLIVAGVALFVILLQVRNPFGVVSVLLNGGLIVLILKYGNAEIQAIAAYALSWFLLLSGVRFVFMHGTGAADAAILRRATRIPRFVWAALWLVGSLLALWIGGHLLV